MNAAQRLTTHLMVELMSNPVGKVSFEDNLGALLTCAIHMINARPEKDRAQLCMSAMGTLLRHVESDQIEMLNAIADLAAAHPEGSA